MDGTSPWMVQGKLGRHRQKGSVGFGIVIRDQHEKIRLAMVFWIPQAAETVAALVAAQLCIEMGIRQVQLEGDAKNVIVAVNSGEPDESGRGQLTEDIRFSLRSIPVWEMRYTRREGNKVAHALASLATHETMDMVWLYNPPDWIRNILQAEISA
jgi:ribonuclease HI